VPVRLDDPRGGRRPDGEGNGNGPQRNRGNGAPGPGGDRQQPQEPWHPGAARYARDQPSLRDPAPRSREYEYDARDSTQPPEPQSRRTGPPETRPQELLTDRPEVLREPGTSKAKAGKGKSAKGKSAQGKASKTKPGTVKADSSGEQGVLPPTGAKTVAGPIKAGKQVDTRSGRRTGRRRVRAVPAVAMTSAFVVLAALGTTAYYKLGPGAPNGSGGAAAFNAITNSKALTALAAERQQIVDMNNATQVVTTVSKPLTASVSQATSSNSSSTTSSDVGVEDAATPGEAQEIAQELMPSYGFSVTDQFSCLYDIWERESGWQYDAENTASGAYGIPQSLPASKMAMFGSDYLTDATTQIKWGLWYIQNRYGTPCAAWDFELDNGFY